MGESDQPRGLHTKEQTQIEMGMTNPRVTITRTTKQFHSIIVFYSVIDDGKIDIFEAICFN